MNADMPDETWMQRGICASVGGDLWYPEKGESSGTAKAMCRRCPVRPECLEYALANDEKFGVWGGMSAWQRNAENERRKRARPSASASSAVAA